MIEVYFGTNRNPNRTRNPDDYGPHLNGRGTQLRFGKAQVSESLDDVESVSTANELLRPSRGRQVLGSAQIFDEIRQQMLAGHDTVLFIHGFNYTFKESLIDAARLKRRYEKDDRTYTFFVFTWPSDGSLLPFIAYGNDRFDAKVSGPALGRGLLKLRDFVQRLSRGSEPRVRFDLGREATLAGERAGFCRGRLHLMAHSMGVYALRHAIQGMRKERGDDLPRLFDEILLFAGDEDADAFEHFHKLALLPTLTRRVTMYHNREDIPIAISDLTKGNPDRLGSDGPRNPRSLPAKVSIVDCADVVNGFQEHRYHESEQTIVDDIRAVLDGGRSDRIANRTYVAETNSYRLG